MSSRMSTAEEVHWFVRPWPRWVWLIAFLATGSGMACGLGLALLLHSWLQDLGVVEQIRATYGEGALYGGLSVPYVGSGLVGYWLVCAWGNRRYGVCALSPHELTTGLRPGKSGGAPRPGDAQVVVPLATVQSWRRTRHGLLLAVEGRGRFSRWVSPVFLPVRDHEEQALAERLLSAGSGGRSPPSAR